MPAGVQGVVSMEASVRATRALKGDGTLHLVSQSVTGELGDPLGDPKNASSPSS